MDWYKTFSRHFEGTSPRKYALRVFAVTLYFSVGRVCKREMRG